MGEKKINEFKEIAIKVIQDEILTGKKKKKREKKTKRVITELLSTGSRLLYLLMESKNIEDTVGDKNVFGKNNGSKFSKLTETYKMQ